MDAKDPNALAMILAAELHRVGVFDAANLASIAKRLEESGEPDLAERVAFLPCSNALTDPLAMRAGIHVIGGGKPSED